ncbi:MAG: hypothetical protein H0T85_00205 [Geodermatophilaceae bacterium]|nr:hypothetical protein [Geodermatophilaceae bacterium]
MTDPTRTDPARTLAARELVGSYTDYDGAQRAVDFLSDEKFPVQRSAIIGSDLRIVELVVGRLDVGRAALAGAASGAWFGLLVGLFLGLFATETSGYVSLLLWGLVFGALAGAAFGAAGHAATRGRRDFVSRRQISAARYDVVVDSEFANQARTLLTRLS